jgi:thermitase
MLRRVLSPVATLQVLPAGTPTDIAPSDLSQLVFDADSGGEIVCNEVLAFVLPETEIDLIETAISRVAGTLIGISPGEQVNVWQVQIPCSGASGVHDAAAALEADPLIVGAEPNGAASASGLVTDDPRFADQYGIRAMEADVAWAITRGRVFPERADPYDFIIGVVDTGVDYNHPDLAGKVLLGRDWIHRDDDPMDDEDHGTHVAGTAAAHTNNNTGVSGTSWSSWILAVKSINSNRVGTHVQIARGIRDASNGHARIINLSLSGPRRGFVLARAIHRVNKSGRLVVAAAGNDNCPDRQYPAGYRDTESFLGGLYQFDTRLLSVGATDDSDDHAIWIPGVPQCTTDSGSNFGPWVDITAPGTSIVSTLRNGGYVAKNGTSMATPHVAGVAALLWSVAPDRSNREIEAILRATADLTGRFHPDGRQVARANAFQAVFQTAARTCERCPEAPEVAVRGTSVFMSGPRSQDELQSRSIHGASVPLLLADRYEVQFSYVAVSWDTYNFEPGGGWFDAFSVSTSKDPYYELSLSDPLDAGDPLLLGFLWGGGLAKGSTRPLPSVDFDFGMRTVVIRPASICTPLPLCNHLNVVLDTASAPDADRNFPSWGAVRILDITPLP